MLLLHGFYFAIHYLFASQTTRVTLSTAFMAMMMAAGAPPILVGLTMAFHTSLFGGITHSPRVNPRATTAPVSSAQGLLPSRWHLRRRQRSHKTVFGGLWWKVIGLY